VTCTNPHGAARGSIRRWLHCCLAWQMRGNESGLVGYLRPVSLATRESRL